MAKGMWYVPLGLAGFLVFAWGCRGDGGQPRRASGEHTDRLLAENALGESAPYAAVARAGERLDLFARSQRGELFHKAWDGHAWSPAIETWHTVGDGVVGAPEVVSLGTGRIDLLVRRADGRLYVKSQVDGVWDSSADAWRDLGSPSGTFLAGHPSAATRSGGGAVGVVAGDGHVYLKEMIDAHGRQSSADWEDLGAGFIGAAKLVSSPSGPGWVVARKRDGRLYVRPWALGGDRPVDSVWRSLGAPDGLAVAGNPTAVAFAGDRVCVAIVATDGNAYARFGRGQAWDTGWSLVGPSVGAPELVAGSQGVEAFALRADGSLGMKSWRDGAWEPPGPTWASLGKSTDSPLVFVPTVVGMPGRPWRVFALDANGTLRTAEVVEDSQAPATGWVSLGGPMGGDPVDMAPFWEATTMYNESVVMVSWARAEPRARLLWSPTEILSVRHPSLAVEYLRGVDWDFDAASNTLFLPNGSHVPSVDERMLYPTVPGPGTTPKTGGGNIFHREGSVFHDWQVAVTYRHSARPWTGPTPAVAAAKLSGTLKRLSTGNSLRVLLLGDSIAAGYNASGFGPTLAPPFQPSWGELFVRRLRDTYSSPITFLNPSVAGMTSDWGKTAAQALLHGGRPDLAILAFGMNDGMPSGGLTLAAFRRNIEEIMRILDGNGREKVEFILVTPMLPNAQAPRFWGRQRDFRKVLAAIAQGRDDTAIVDMTTVHEHLLGRKPFLDMGGNDLNHPNDFLIRWYAQMLSALLVP